MQIDLPATLSASYDHGVWYSGQGKRVVGSEFVEVSFGQETVAKLKPVRRFETTYDAQCDEEQEINIANETLANALTKLFALLEQS